MPGNWKQAWLRMKALLRREQFDRDLNDELTFHLAMREEKIRAQGLANDEAHYAARRQFGNATQLKEQTRDMWTFVSLESLWRDFAFAVRTMRKRAGFAATAIVTLGLGIGASTAIFSVIYNVLIQPFPYAGADRFFGLEIHDPNKGEVQGRVEYPGPEFLDYVEKNHVFDRAIANAGADVLYNLGDGTIRFHGVLCTPGTFDFFGMSALKGRVMSAADYEPGAPPVFVMLQNLDCAIWPRSQHPQQDISTQRRLTHFSRHHAAALRLGRRRRLSSGKASPIHGIRQRRISSGLVPDRPPEAQPLNQSGRSRSRHRREPAGANLSAKLSIAFHGKVVFFHRNGRRTIPRNAVPYARGRCTPVAYCLRERRQSHARPRHRSRT
jgi:hypothetical protein